MLDPTAVAVGQHADVLVQAVGLERDVASQVRGERHLIEPLSAPMSEDEVDQEESGEEAEAEGLENETGSSGRPARGVKRKKGGRRNPQVRKQLRGSRVQLGLRHTLPLGSMGVRNVGRETGRCSQLETGQGWGRPVGGHH